MQLQSQTLQQRAPDFFPLSLTSDYQVERKSQLLKFTGGACRCSKASWVLGTAGLLAFGLAASGCVSKATAQAQARAAFLAGQQQALERLQTQNRGPSVTFVGEVRNTLIPWTADLTLAKAIVAAEYYGRTDPNEIVVTRDGQEMRIDPKRLLSGGDILLQPRDVVELRH